MTDDEQKRAREIYEWWLLYKAAADELHVDMVAASNQYAKGVGGKPTYGVEILLKTHREKQTQLWKKLESLIGTGVE